MKYHVHLEDWIAWTADSGFAIRPGHALFERLGDPVLPRLLRRRLNATGRAACDALSLLDNGDGQPLLHASRHGDVSSSLDMLQALNSGDPVSPAGFSMSVHNAVLGVYSIARQHLGPTLALGACGNEFDALIGEARGYLASGKSSVIALFSEGDIPHDFKPHTQSPAHPCLVALKLTVNRGPRLLSTPSTAPARPTPLDVIHWLSQDGDTRLNTRYDWRMEHP